MGRPELARQEGVRGEWLFWHRPSVMSKDWSGRPMLKNHLDLLGSHP